MTDIEDDQLSDEPAVLPAGERRDPIMTLFIAGMIVFLAAFAILILIAASRPPAGL